MNQVPITLKGVTQEGLLVAIEELIKKLETEELLIVLGIALFLFGIKK